MRFATLSLAALGSLGLLLFSTAGAAPAPAARAAAESYAVDPVHSTVIYKVMHNNASWFYGRFADISGSFTYDESDPSKCSLLIEVPAESVDSGNGKLDQHLRSPDFFDVKQFPVISFKSKKVSSSSKGVYSVTGDLLLHGVKKEITIEVEQTGISDWNGTKVMGFHTTFAIDRTDFGMTYGAGGPLGSDVELIVSIEAGRS